MYKTHHHNSYRHDSPVGRSFGSSRGYESHSHSGTNPRGNDMYKPMHRTVYNDATTSSSRRGEIAVDRNVHSPPSHRLSSRGRPSLPVTSIRRFRVPATSSARLSASSDVRNYRPRTRSRSPIVPRSDDDLRNALNGRQLPTPVVHLPVRRNLSSGAAERQQDIRDSGCRPCGIIGFLTYTQYRHHMESDLHKANKRRISGEGKNYPNTHEETYESPRKQSKANSSGDFLTVDATGIFHGNRGDAAKKKPIGASAKNESSSNGPPSVCSDRDSKAQQSQLQEDNFGPLEVPEVQEPNVAYGIQFITPIKGLYCRLCRKFFTSEKAALELHAKSVAHFTAFKRSVEIENQKYSTSIAKPSTVEQTTPGVTETDTIVPQLSADPTNNESDIAKQENCDQRAGIEEHAI